MNRLKNNVPPYIAGKKFCLDSVIIMKNYGLCRESYTNLNI